MVTVSCREGERSECTHRRGGGCNGRISDLCSCSQGCGKCGQQAN